MINYDKFYESISDTFMRPWLETIPDIVAKKLYRDKHGNFDKWLKLIDDLPDVEISKLDLTGGTLVIGDSSDLTDSQKEQFTEVLKELMPWRKGPFEFFGINVDTEWRSDLKWQRLSHYIQPLKDRVVLDVGCSNGYYCWRMAVEGAAKVVGIDPYILYVMQYHLINKYLKQDPVTVLPLAIEDLPESGQFDTVFSMGVLYHQRSPFDHFLKLKKFLRPGGELVLETLIIEGDEMDRVLVPEGRYAMMRNVWCIPTVNTLIHWLKKTGFTNMTVVDVTATTSEEQRRTEWMDFQSFESFLDPDDSSKTIEGYPAPIRAVITATS
ncbi:MAG: tRNA 5-methoxyuridine(34)/uridine 5-oxyacetic acid(34) synthase CmoB [Lentisphaeria bacterium]|nr:tRNA 5-methoxyuridine(34)/uridine 5-oxyacetic acid(34) synthase CmoB [Lentisphaeria bacterium]